MSEAGSPTAPSRISGAMNRSAGRRRPRRHGGQAVAAVAEVGDRGPAAGAHQHRERRDRADDDPVQMGVLQRAEEVACQGEHGGNRSGAAAHRFPEPLAVDPVADPVGQVADPARVVDVHDARVVELAQRLRLAHEPGADGVVEIEVDPHADPALQDLVVCLEEHPLGRGGDDALQIDSAVPGPRACARRRPAGRGRSAERTPAPLDSQGGAADGGGAPAPAPGG